MEVVVEWLQEPPAFAVSPADHALVAALSAEVFPS